MDATTAQSRLIRLRAERFHALELGIENPSPYMTRLEAAIEDAQRDYVTSAVTEIALLRDSLGAVARG